MKNKMSHWRALPAQFWHSISHSQTFSSSSNPRSSSKHHISQKSSHWVELGQWRDLEELWNDPHCGGGDPECLPHRVHFRVLLCCLLFFFISSFMNSRVLFFFFLWGWTIFRKAGSQNVLKWETKPQWCDAGQSFVFQLNSGICWMKWQSY